MHHAQLGALYGICALLAYLCLFLLALVGKLEGIRRAIARRNQDV